MKIQINGEWRQLDAPQHLAHLLTLIEAKPPFAVALNQTFVPRSRYTETAVQENDAIEIVQAMAGG